MADLINDFPIPTVCEILDTIKALSSYKSKIYFAGMEAEYSFGFSDACTHKQIEGLEKSLGRSLPEDYKQFLIYTNGLDLPTGISSSRLCSLREIRQIMSIFNWFPSDFLPIGMCADGTICVTINLSEQGRQNIYIIDVMADECFRRLNCDFRTFLDRFIATYGNAFWEWGAVSTNIKQSAQKNVDSTLLKGMLWFYQ